MIRRPPRSTRVRSSAASDVYKRQQHDTFGLTHQRGQQVLGGDLGVVLLARERLGGADGLARLAGETVGFERHVTYLGCTTVKLDNIVINFRIPIRGSTAPDLS